MDENKDTRLTILVVDDYDETRFMLRKALEMSGYHVVEAANGFDAVETAQHEHPDLILMDLCLPLRSGVSAVYGIRKYPELREVPIVAVTAYTEADLHLDALKAGCREYVSKPIDLKHLNDLLKRLLRKNSDRS